jgi:ElaB/YqjD/DUF883 family membrane-anchored ribosome-binding protein
MDPVPAGAELSRGILPYQDTYQELTRPMADDAIDRMTGKGVSEADRIKEQTIEALEEAARKLRSTDISVSGEDVKSILHGVQDKMDHFREEIGTKYHEVEAEYQKKVEPVEHMICDHPIPAVMVAMGFGFLLGMLISRSRD